MQSQLTCRLNTDDTEYVIDDSNLKGKLVGPPGKAGPRGFPGDLRQCNCSDNTEIRHLLQETQQHVSELKSQVSQLQSNF